jgi:hypothetical protein
MLQLLNAPQGQRFYPTLRTWSLSPRGGLVESTPRGADILEHIVKNEGGNLQVLDTEWAEASNHFGLDDTQFLGDPATRCVVVAAYRRVTLATPTLDDNDIGL